MNSSRRTPVIRPALLIAGLALFAHPMTGQSAGREPAVTELPTGARATGLGAAPVGAADVDLFRLHPALAGASTGMQLSAATFGSGATSFSLATARRWFGGGVAIGLALESLEYNGRSPGGRAGGLAPIFSGPGGTNAVSETAVGVTVSSELFGLQVGATGRAVAARFGQARSTDGLLDIGASSDVGPVTLALSARGLGGSRSIAGLDVDPPNEILFGAGAYGQQLGPLDLGFGAEIGRRGDGELRAGGGLELGYYPVQGRTFVGRVGFRHVPGDEADRALSFGASYWGDDLVLEWGWRPVEGEDGLHVFTIGWR